MKYLLITLALIADFGLQAQKTHPVIRSSNVPIVFTNIVERKGEFYYKLPKTGDLAPEKISHTFYTYNNIVIEPQGTENGIVFDFNKEDFSGTIYYGLYAYKDAKYPYPVIFKKSAKIINGKAKIDLKQLGGKYDNAHYGQRGKLKLGYRITNVWGEILYDGKIEIKGNGPFSIDLSIIEGPFVNKLKANSVVISFRTNRPCTPYVEVNGKKYYAAHQIMENMFGDIKHEIAIQHLNPETTYKYTVHYGDNNEHYSFKTAPKEGSRHPFTFAFSSGSRKGNGGGERDIYGVNGYIIKKMAALALKENAVFMQFTGNLITGYSDNVGEQRLEYTNWKRTMEPFWHYMPFNVGPGNHEALLKVFDDGSKYGISVDRFPFNSVSDERVFADEFVNPVNGPASEDGVYYDPDKNTMNFPPYKETAYYYIYDNVAIIVVNSDYWYTPNEYQISETGGNPHAYIMDKQLNWLKKTIEQFDRDKNIDYIFVTLHSPVFPNAGHAGDDMWYGGNNKVRPYVAGKPVKKGIIERREEFLNIVVNESTKVLALLCGDEHTYSRLHITDSMPRYPEHYKGKRVHLSRPLWQITNGSSGAPYYGLQNMPWTKSIKKFSTQYALVLFDVDGKKVKLRVINPDTLEEIESVELR